MVISLLDSLVSRSWRYRYRWVVVDNGSRDGSPDEIIRRFPAVHLIRNRQNLGVAARNQILQAADGRYVCFLDADTRMVETALDTLVQTMDGRPEIALAGPKLVYEDGRLQLSCRSFPSFFHILCEGTPLRKLFGRTAFVRAYTMEDWHHGEDREVDWVYGACLICRREVLEALRGFDPAFRFKYEDVDLCFRAKEAGLKTFYIPQATVVHFLHGEQKGFWHPLLLTHIRSATRYLLKDYYGFGR